VGLREKQTAERKRRILDVADKLIRQTGGIEFSMRMLAELSEVSPATPYNLFGSKEGILSSSLARSLTRTVFEGLSPKSADPLDFVITASGTAVDLLVEQKQLLRPLYQYLLGVIDPVHRPVHIKRSVKYWRTVAETGLDGACGGKGVDDTDRESVGYMLFAHFVGLLELWVHEDIDDATFRARAIYGGLQMILPFAGEESAVGLRSRLRDAKAAVAKLDAR
jgi:AcrR family transcriptional regulator